MIDIHTHILPRFDDGAKDSETATAMLENLREQGVDTVVLTPHYYGRKLSPSEFLERRDAAFERFRAHIPEEITVRLGAELHFSGLNMPQNEELCPLAIEGTKYILVELPFTSEWTGSLLDKLSEFIHDTDYTPIIAHVERYREVLKAPAIAAKLVAMGCLLQVNAQAFLNRKEKKFAFTLLKHGFVHCIGTDAHDMQERSPACYTAAKNAVLAAGCETEWKRAEEIMRKVLAGEQVCVETGRAVRKFLGKYF